MDITKNSALAGNPTSRISFITVQLALKSFLDSDTYVSLLNINQYRIKPAEIDADINVAIAAPETPHPK